MDKQFLVGIDLGSSAVKTMVINAEGDILASAGEEYPMYFPQPGWVEYNPEDWWNAVKSTLKTCLSHADVDSAAIAGIGVSGLGCCCVPMDEEGNIIFPALPWCDMRATEEVDYLIDNCKEAIHEASGGYPSTLNTMPHLMWIKAKKPDIYAKLYKYTESSGFIIQRLTGEFILDWSSAVFVEYGIDLNTMDYSRELIDAMGLDFEKFPRLLQNSKSAGGLTSKAAEETGLAPGTPVFCGGNDVTSGAIGAGAIKAGQGFYYSGTGSNTTVLTDQLRTTSPHLLNCLTSSDKNVKMLDGVQGSIGYCLKWFRDACCQGERQAAELLDCDPFEMMTFEGLKTEPGAGGLLFFPFLFGKFSPVLSPYPKGAFFGINPNTTRAQMIRAIIEGCCFDSYQSLETILNLGIEIDEMLFVGGPSKSDLWCQIYADVCNREVVAVESADASPFGDAITAGVGVGLYSSFAEAVEKVVKVRKRFEPDEANHRLYQDLYKVYIDLYDNTLGDFEKLAKVKEKHGITS
ncbi:MAG: FGGY family carbohydrate kinase [Phycisphaerae bacterium]|nr:FGGY family carbohydrate kinase [Phycisphaerae bacterium]